MTTPVPIWSDDFLKADIREQDEYKSLLDDSTGFDDFISVARDALNSMQGVHEPDEELTTNRVVLPILQALGWPSTLSRRSLTSRDEIDLAIFADEEIAEGLLAKPERQQVLGATGIVECKRWQRDFDARGSGSRPGETGAQQLQRYLLLAGADSGDAVRWGLLTNGAHWRLYSYRVRPRERAWEIDLADLLATTDLFSQVVGEADTHKLRTAYLLLRRDSWIPSEGKRDSFLDRLLDAGRHRDAEVADDLSDIVFKNVFPAIVRLFWNKKPGATGDAIARASLYFLYRLLFIYYAEDRGMLDTENQNYRPLSLRYGVREPVAEQYGKASFSIRSTRYWRHLQELTQIIDQGEPSLNLPAYNGGLFASSYSILDEITLSDAELAPLIYDLSHTSNGTYVSYRNLQVQQLGSIYERLLERVPQRDDDGLPDVTLSPYARKDSGSYYTPQELVDLIVEQTLRPLVEERVAAFRNNPTEENDPAESVLKLRILDPAMGSGHFLITAIDWLAEELSKLVDAEWDESPSHISPVRARLWDFEEAWPGLDDHTLLQRMVLKSCIYGVDKNPMAVELAKVALWLHTFTGELPLPYLEHRIIVGDSLLGISGEQSRSYIAEWGTYPLNDSFNQDIHSGALQALAADDLLDLTIEDIRESGQRYDATRQHVYRHRNPLNLVAGLRWLAAGMKKREREKLHAPLTAVLNGHPVRAVSILFNGDNREGLTPITFDYRNIRDNANAVTRDERIMHWEIEFPHVMLDGGFDAVIGNPPWDEVKLDEIEWWEPRDRAVALAETADERQEMINERHLSKPDLYYDFRKAQARARSSSSLFLTSDDFPHFGKADANLYGLFVDRALWLVRHGGVVGLLVKSGVFADHGSRAFIRSVTKANRLLAIMDFENRRRTAGNGKRQSKWFADVHPQERFCALIIGGEGRTANRASFGFLLSGKAELESDERVFQVRPADLGSINPNTGQIPQFRSTKDAHLISGLYNQHPVLVRRTDNETTRNWPIRYRQGMFHSKNDSSFFKTEASLNDLKAYPIQGNRYRRGTDEYVPMYHGLMIHQYDHRANSVGINPKNTKRPYVSVRIPDSDRANRNFLPTHRLWVLEDEVVARQAGASKWVLGFRDVSSATNGRTVIAAILPLVGIRDTIGLLLDAGGLTALNSSCLLANLNSLTLDFVAARKITSSHVKKFAIEQLPMIAPKEFDKTFGTVTARQMVRDHVLHLTYTAYDLTPFARDLGYEGEPFIWDPAERRQLRARLDALFFHLYGLSEDDADYILDQFPVLEKNERREFGHYLTKQLVLGQYRALEQGDTAAEISEQPTA